MRADIAAVLFDFDHTLGTDNHLEQRVLRSLADRYCIERVADADLDAVLVEFRSGRISLSDALTSAFSRWGYDGPVVGEFKRIALERLPDSLTTMPGASETLDALRRRGLTVALLTNGWTELQLEKASLIGFDGPVFASEAIGAWKPMRAAFDIALSRLNVGASQALYVGDSPETDIAGARAAGLTTVWADLEGQAYPPSVIKPDFAITKLAQLLED